MCKLFHRNFIKAKINQCICCAFYFISTIWFTQCIRIRCILFINLCIEHMFFVLHKQNQIHNNEDWDMYYDVLSCHSQAISKSFNKLLNVHITSYSQKINNQTECSIHGLNVIMFTECIQINWFKWSIELKPKEKHRYNILVEMFINLGNTQQNRSKYLFAMQKQF